MSILSSPAFTLVELLIGLALISLLVSLSAYQGINSFQLALHRLEDRDQSLQQEAAIGKSLRHIVVGTSL